MSCWNYNIQHAKQISGDGNTGKIYEQLPLHDVNRYRVITFEKPHHVVIELQAPKPLQHYGFDLSPSENDTLVKYWWRVDLTRYGLLKYIPDGMFKNWLLSFARKQVMNVIKPATEENFRRLKTFLETGVVSLQNGQRHRLTGDYSLSS